MSEFSTLQIIIFSILVILQLGLLIGAVTNWTKVRSGMDSETFAQHKITMFAGIAIICLLSIIGPILWLTVLRPQVPESTSKGKQFPVALSQSTMLGISSPESLDSLWEER